MSLSYFLSIIIVLAPVFSNYVLLGPISIGDFFVFTAVVLLIKNLKIDILSIGSIFVAFIIIFIGFCVLYGEGVSSGFFRMGFYYSAFFFVVSLQKVNFDKFFSVYINCCIFFSVSLIFQWMAYKFLNSSFPLQLPIPYYESDTLKVLNDLFRSGGWFKEPSYFAIFLIPATFYLLSQKEYLKYFTIVSASLISTSSLAIFVFLTSILLSLIRTERGWVWLTCLMPVFLAIFFCVLYFFNEWTVVSRVVDIYLDGGTLNERALPFLDIIQLSINIIPNPIAHNLVVMGGDNGAIWYASAAYILASVGWVGFLFLSLSFLRLGIFAGVIIFALSLTTHIFSGPYSFFLAFSFFALSKELRRLNLE